LKILSNTGISIDEITPKQYPNKGADINLAVLKDLITQSVELLQKIFKEL
jgi:hypothetical protein